MTKTLKERYNEVHDWIMGGPNHELQSWVDSGTAWHLEGHVGRTAMNALRSGALVLPPERHKDYYGNVVPSYEDVDNEIGSPGSVANAEEYQFDEVLTEAENDSNNQETV